MRRLLSLITALAFLATPALAQVVNRPQGNVPQQAAAYGAVGSAPVSVTASVGLPSNTVQVGGTAVSTGNGTAGAGSQRVTIASDNTAFTVNVGTISGTVTLPTGASTAALQGVQGTGLNPPSGGSGEIGFLSGIYNQIISTSPQAVAPQAQTSGGCTPGVALSAASNNSTLISTGAHTLCKLVLINTTSTIYYVRTYDSSSAPTCSSSTGATAMYPVPAQTTGAGIAVPIGPFGEAYASGLGFCITGASGLNDNTNAATGVTLNYSYK